VEPWVRKLQIGTGLYALGTLLMILPIIAANKGISVVEPSYSTTIVLDFGWQKYYELTTDSTKTLDQWTKAQQGCGYFFLVVMLMNVAIGIFLLAQLIFRNIGKAEPKAVSIAQTWGFWVIFWQILATVVFEQVTIGGLVANLYTGSWNIYLGWAGVLSIVGACIYFVGTLALGGAQGARFTVGAAAPSEQTLRMQAAGQQVPTISSSGAASSQQIGVMTSTSYGQPMYATQQPMYGSQQMYGQQPVMAYQGPPYGGQPAVGMPVTGQPVVGQAVAAQPAVGEKSGGGMG